MSESNPQVNAVHVKEEKHGGDLDLNSIGNGEGWVDLRWLMIYFGCKIATGLADGLVERVKWRDTQI